MALLPFDFNTTNPWALSPFDQYNSLISGNMLASPQMRNTFHIDMVENDNEFAVHADLPGVKMDDVDVSIEDGDMLVVKGHREREYESESTWGGKRRERTFGSYQRKIKLPSNADKSNPRATYNDGVLTITFPKSPNQPQVHKIPLIK